MVTRLTTMIRTISLDFVKSHAVVPIKFWWMVGGRACGWGERCAQASSFFRGGVIWTHHGHWGLIRGLCEGYKRWVVTLSRHYNPGEHSGCAQDEKGPHNHHTERAIAVIVPLLLGLEPPCGVVGVVLHDGVEHHDYGDGVTQPRAALRDLACISKSGVGGVGAGKQSFVLKEHK